MQEADFFLRQCKLPFNYQLSSGLDRLHSTIVGPNLHDACADESAFGSERHRNSDDPWSIVASYPTPVGPPVRLGRSSSNGLDPALHIVRQKLLHDKKRDFWLAFCKKRRQAEEIDEIRAVVESGGVFCDLDPTVVALAEHLAKDPAPNFKGCFNRYYGNGLVNIGIEGRSYLLYAQASGGLLVQEIGQKKNFTLDRGMSRTIFQLDSRQDIVSLRHSDRVCLRRLKIDDNPAFEELFTVEDEESVLASCLGEYDELLVLTSDMKLKIFDLESQSAKRTVQGQLAQDSWACMVHQSQNVVMLCDRNSAKLLDLRSEEVVHDWPVGSVVEECEEIFSACGGRSLQYVTTSHHLLGLDVRKGFHQKWTHGLSNPFVTLFIPEGAADLIFITGDSNGDIACIQNSHAADFDVDFIRRMPAHLPSLRECLEEARTRGHLCSPGIEPRFSMSTMGLQVVDKSDGYDIFFCTSVGDLFSQRLRVVSAPGGPPEFQDGDLELYRQWMDESRKMQTDPENPVKVTSVADASRFLNVFNDDSSSESTSDEEPEVSQIRQRWMRPKRQLLKYCDVLAPRLLSAWDIDDDEWGVDWPSDEEPSEASSNDSDEVNSRVMSWLSQSGPSNDK
ncbi:Hypothetical protein NTJ_15128 [Nesidiocoris tenuis]|uniref:Uncharacterized protein n=1 Tax=Nesidiocoris tenuis TaxID=355587 RepID=A0ABN7BD59_9HEMI|nr:Hypothetical protein NTJ_15128 [Nesidiocoris tenuis]